MLIKDCKGCILKDDFICHLFSKTLTCPCSNCLIKMMCRKDCKPFVDYSNEMRKRNKKKGE